MASQNCIYARQHLSKALKALEQGNEDSIKKHISSAMREIQSIPVGLPQSMKV